ncbi:MAG: hypothetical protein JW822_09545 [Spirochaetales bacterium]|nr:hypothetical protein [Spirochaetales bacterium]
MKKQRSKIILAPILVLTSAGLYVLHYMFFHDAHHIYIYLVGDLAFLPVEVLLVSIVIENLLNRKEKKEKLEKLNMIIETFFSEFGKDLLIYASNYDKNIETIKSILVIEDCDRAIDFKTAFRTLKDYRSDIRIMDMDLPKLRDFLKTKRHFLLGLLQNPNLLEHQSFTETLMALFHITEELAARDFSTISEEDLEHTKIDIERAYSHLIHQWLKYIEYIQKHYPYFFLYALRTNPFDENACWVNRWFEQAEESI